MILSRTGLVAGLTVAAVSLTESRAFAQQTQQPTQQPAQQPGQQPTQPPTRQPVQQPQGEATQGVSRERAEQEQEQEQEQEPQSRIGGSDGAFGRRPFRRIFGVQTPLAANSQRLEMTMNVSGGYDDNILAQDAQEGDPRQLSGFYPASTAELRYSRRWGTALLDIIGAAAMQYYPQLEQEEQLDQNYDGAISFEGPIGSRYRVILGHSMAAANFYTLGGLAEELPDRPLPPGQELLDPNALFGVAREGGWQSHSRAALSRRTGRRGSLEFSYGYTQTEFSALRSKFSTAGIRYNHTVGRSSTLVSGYTYRRAEPEGSDPLIFHDIDIGIDYHRSLGRSRRTSVSFSTGTAVVQDETDREYRVLGQAQLTHLVGRSWSTSVGYHRGLEFLDALSQLAATDAFTATLNGFLTPALETTISATYSHGYLGGTEGAPLTTRAIVADMQYGLSRYFALEGQYLYLLPPVRYRSHFTADFAECLAAGCADWSDDLAPVGSSLKLKRRDT